MPMTFQRLSVFVGLFMGFAVGASAQAPHQMPNQHESGGVRYLTVDGDPLGVQIYTLKNGLTVYLSVNHTEPRVQTMIAVAAGSKYDPPDATGLAHYLEHLLFKGT